MSYEIKEYHGEYNTRPRSKSDVEYIVVHYTGSGTSFAPAALNNCQYFSRADRQSSAHYFIDDSSIYEYADPSTKLTWHCGDGKGRYGITNTNSIGIEVCQDGDRPFTEAEIERLRWLVRKLMADFGVPASKVVRHYDASRKLCPFYYTPGGSGGTEAWNKLHERITREEATAGWVKSGNRWWWRNSDGTWPASKWKKVNGRWYWFDAKGWMSSSAWISYRGKWYWLKESGAMAADEFIKRGGKWYYLDQTGAMREDPIEVNPDGSLKL